MNSEIIIQKKVRNGVYAVQYKNGTININGYQYYGYSLTDAINTFRKKHPKY